MIPFRSKLDWTIDAGGRLAARPLRHDKLGVLEPMLRVPEIAEWYDDDPLADQLKEIGEHIDSTYVSPFLVTLEGLPEDQEEARRRAVVDLATLVGALSLARATGTTPLSEEILDTVRDELTARRSH